MVWKILSVLSAASLGGACYFAYSNQMDLKAERNRLAAAEGNKKLATERKSQHEEAAKVRKTTLDERQKELQTAKDDAAKLDVEAKEKEAALALIKSNLEQVTQQVTSVDKQIKDAGDIPALLAQIEKLNKEKAEAEAAVANQLQRIAAAKENYAGVVAQAAKMRETAARGAKGIVEPDFSARVSQYFPEWDFAILSKGNSGGVFTNADLEVKRGKNVIAKLKVRNVEQYGAIADLVPGSLAEGEAIRRGDVVVAAANQSAASPAKSTPAAPQKDGAPTAPAPAPMGAPSSDPFGAAPPAAPAAPAPASDPFGAAPAPAPAAPAPAADPFGSAPAAPATPAPAADPFAPAK